MSNLPKAKVGLLVLSCSAVDGEEEDVPKSSAIADLAPSSTLPSAPAFPPSCPPSYSSTCTRLLLAFFSPLLFALPPPSTLSADLSPAPPPNAQPTRTSLPNPSYHSPTHHRPPSPPPAPPQTQSTALPSCKPNWTCRAECCMLRREITRLGEWEYTWGSVRVEGRVRDGHDRDGDQRRGGERKD